MVLVFSYKLIDFSSSFLLISFLVEKNANTFFLDNILKVVSWHFTVHFYILLQMILKADNDEVQWKIMTCNQNSAPY